MTGIPELPKPAPAAPAPAPAPAVPEQKPAAAAPATDVPELGAPAADPDAVPELGAPPVADEPDEQSEADPADQDAPADDKPADDKPIEYEFEAPEGVALREPVIEAYKTALQKHKVAPDVAKDLLSTMLPTIQRDLDAQVQEQIDRQRTTWQAELEQQHGPKLGDVRRLANRALAHAQQSGAISPAFIDFVRGSALAANPDFNNLLAAFGQRITNDRPPKSGGPAPATPLSALDAAAAAYDREDSRGG